MPRAKTKKNLPAPVTDNIKEQKRKRKLKKLKKQYKAYVQNQHQENFFRARQGLPIIPIEPFTVPSKLIPKEDQLNREPATIRTTLNRKLTYQYESWPHDSDGYPFYRPQQFASNYVNGQDVRVHCETPGELTAAKMQRTAYLLDLYNKGYELTKKDFRLIRHYVGSGKYNRDKHCDMVIKLAKKHFTWSSILKRMEIPASTHSRWRKSRPEYNRACLIAETIMNGELTDKFQERWESNITKDGDFMKVLERFNGNQWQDPKILAQRDQNTGNTYIYQVNPSLLQPQPASENERIAGNDPRWKKALPSL